MSSPDKISKVLTIVGGTIGFMHSLYYERGLYLPEAFMDTLVGASFGMVWYITLPITTIALVGHIGIGIWKVSKKHYFRIEE